MYKSHVVIEYADDFSIITRNKKETKEIVNVIKSGVAAEFSQMQSIDSRQRVLR